LLKKRRKTLGVHFFAAPCTSACIATVHMPRIGHNTPGFNWYGTERLIQKHLSRRAIPTYVYPSVSSSQHVSVLGIRSLLPTITFDTACRLSVTRVL